MMIAPFHYFDNNVKIKEENHFVFSSPGIAYSSEPPLWINKAILTSTLTIRLKIISFTTNQDGPARIFTISHDNYHRNFTIGQVQKDLIIRVRTPQTGVNGLPEYIIPSIFNPLQNKLQPIELEVQIQHEVLQVKINNSLALSEVLPINTFSNWESSYRLALGNELTFLRPWLGEVITADVEINKQLYSYTPETLKTPKNYLAIRENLKFYWVPCLTLDCAIDWTMNFFGFFPFGVLVFLATSRSNRFATVLICSASLSISIEIGQLFFLYRYPSLIDIILNASGGVSAAWMGNRFFGLSPYHGT